MAACAYLWLLFAWDFLGGWLIDAAAQTEQTEETE
jgi:hypothetical protein